MAAAIGSVLENLANGDDVLLAFKWMCNDLEQMAFNGLRITPDLYRQIEDLGCSLGAPEHWKMLDPYVGRA